MSERPPHTDIDATEGIDVPELDDIAVDENLPEPLGEADEAKV
jgi:hypothetical protein